MFIASFIKFFVGFLDELEKTDGRVTLDEICRRAMEFLVQKGVTTKHLKSEAASIVATITARYRDQERGKLFIDAMEMRERALTRLEALLTAHSWYHEDVLLPVQTTSLAVPRKFSDGIFYFFIDCILCCTLQRVRCL